MTKPILAGLLMLFGLSARAQFMTPGPSVTGAAIQAQSALAQSAQMNTMIGAVLLSQCMMGRPPNTLMCMMGAMALMQGMSAQQQANQATQAIATSAAPGVAVPAPVSVVTPTGAAPGLNYLASSGYRVTPAGIVTPSGSTVTSAMLGSPKALASLGFSPSLIKAAQSASNAVHTQANRRIASTKN